MNTAKGGCDDRERACVVVDVICRVEPRRVGAQRDSCSKTVVVAMKKSRIKKSRKRAMLRGVDAIVWAKGWIKLTIGVGSDGEQ
jgi:methionine salvage enolase-phosphatase E1